MSDYSININLADYKRGDKWIGIPSIGPITINGEVPPLTLNRVRMYFRQGNNVFKLDTDEADRDAPIVITDATNWTVTIPEIDTGFLAKTGVWCFDIEFWETGKSAPLTLYKGDITVHGDITN